MEVYSSGEVMIEYEPLHGRYMRSQTEVMVYKKILHVQIGNN